MATSKSHAHSSSTATTGTNDGDNPQSMVIASLRGQVSDLVSQVTQLNSKLVQSYDRISDLEDNMHIASSTLRNSTLKISQLELERTQHLSALNTGLLVEKSHVTNELTRLMERATDEAAQRGMAESARHEIEKDLDDLSAELFGRANTMVAEARLAQAKSERRVQDAEAVLKGAEEAVGSMQAQMQALREEKDRTDREMAEARELMGKGKWVERERLSPSFSLKLLSTHVPYQEFLLFVAHLRQIRPVTPQPPPMATFLPLPFLARLVSEDSDPTLRLDTAPSLNWLTRRSVISAIHQSQLTVEPLSITALLELFAPNAAAAISAFATYSTQASPSSSQHQSVNVTCALCGKPVLPSMSPTSAPAHSHSHSHTPTSGTPVNGTSTNTNSWRPTFFSKSSSGGTPSKQPPPAIHSPTPSVATSISFYPPSTSSGPGRLSPPPTPPLPSPPPSPQVYVFRLQPASASTAPGATPGTVYPLCTTGWCLARLRTTCELWRFVRHGVVERVWDEEVPVLPADLRASTPSKPPIPPRRRTIGVGKLIGLASSALGMEKGAGGSGPTTPTREERFSPPPVRVSGGGGDATPGKRKVSVSAPPPLPRRAASRVEEKKVDEEKQVEAEEPVHDVEKSVEAEEPVHDAEKAAAVVEPPSHLDVVPPDSGATSGPESVYSVEDARTPEPEDAPASQPAQISTTLTAEPDEFVTPEGTPAHSPIDAGATPNPNRIAAPVASTEPSEIPLPDSPLVSTFAAARRISAQPAEASDPTGDAKTDGEAAPVDGAPAPAEAPTTMPAPAPAPTTPARIASPALGAPSRTASPAPPPLPKRAARRTAPVPPGGAAPSPKPTADKALPAETVAELPKASEADTNAVADQLDATASAAPILPPPVHPSHAAPSPPSPESSAKELPPPPVHPSKARPPSVPAKQVEEEPYVGETTWEERTWKELVRLREDMFYARLGTVR